MRFGDKLDVLVVTKGEMDENLNPGRPTEEWKFFGKCAIMPNTAAQSVSLADGKEYIYQYEIYAPLNSKHYQENLIPKENSRIHFVKEDGTIDKEAFVRGFLTLRKRYLKLWV